MYLNPDFKALMIKEGKFKDPETVEWVFFKTNIEKATNIIVVGCDCHRVKISELSKISTTTHQLVTLYPKRFRYGTGPIYYYWFGQCLECKIIWWTNA